MHHHARRAALLLITLLLTMIVPTNSYSDGGSRDITILHTNDLHDFLLPFSYPDPMSKTPAYASMPVIKDIGGIARLATLARRIKSEMAGGALLVDAGDITEGTGFATEYHGEADFAAMSAAGYDAITLGNHEFRPPLPQFRKNLSMARSRVVCANVFDRNTGALTLPPYKIFDLKGVKVAVLGITVPSPEFQASKDGLEFRDPLKTVRRYVPALRKKADVVVVLSHLGYGEDEKLAKEVPGIDVIVGGHSHTRLPAPRLIANGSSSPIEGTLIVHAYEKGAELGRLDLHVEQAGDRFVPTSYNGKLLSITKDFPDDPATARVIADYYKPIAKYFDQVIGTATETIYDDRSRGSAVLNLVCDSIREAAGTPVAIYGIAGVRADILPGTIKAWDVATVLPFKHKIQIMEMTGARLKQALLGFKPGVSGMRYKTAGNVMAEATVDGKPLDDNAMYRVATINWLVGLYFKDVPVAKELNVYARDAVVNYIKARKTISPVKDDRRVVE